jgi:hypothetical protein
MRRSQQLAQEIRLAADLALPLDIVTDTLGVLAIKDGGKTYSALLLVEQMVRAGLPVVAIDPTSVFWGLRVGADGVSPGLPVLILGGDHGDVPIEPTAGRAIADFVVAERQPTVIDFRGFRTKADQLRFSLDFLTRLYEANREALHVVIDEADDLAPQKPFGEETRVLRAVEVLVRRGRSRGLGCTLITQRPACLNKNVLTQCSTLVLGRMMAPQDRKAVELWINAHGTEEEKAELMRSLATLPKQDKWVWAPARGIFRRVQIARRTTFDSSATPKVGVRRPEPKGLAEVDLGALRARMAETIERAKADDPAHLKAQIAELRSKLARAAQPVSPPPPPPPEVRIVERLPEGTVVAVKGAVDKSKAMTSALEELLGTLSRSVERVVQVPAAPARAVRPVSAVRAVEPRPERVKSSERSPVRSGTSDDELKRPHRLLLARLAHSPDGSMSIVELALATVYAHSGGGFRNNVGRLRALGLLTGDNDESIQITAEGIDQYSADDSSRIVWRDALVAEWCKHIKKKAEVAILRAVQTEEMTSGSIEATGVSLERVAEMTEYESTGGGFRNAVGRLRSLGIVSGKEILHLHPIFFVYPAHTEPRRFAHVVGT